MTAKNNNFNISGHEVVKEPQSVVIDASVALRESEARYHQLVSNIPAALYQFEITADGTNRMNYVSARFSEMFEISAAAVVADILVLFDRVVPEDQESFYRSIQDSAISGQSWVWEGRIFMPAGDIKWMRGESIPRHEPRGAIVWDGILTDVTDRKNAERRLKFTQFAVDSSADGIALIKPDGSFAYANKAMCQMLGYSLAELYTLHVWDIDDNTSLSTWESHWQTSTAAGSYTIEAYHQRKNGERYPVEISLNYFEFEDEKYKFTRVRNITDRIQSQLDLAASQQKYYNLIQSINGVVWEYDLITDRFSFVSDRAVALFGYPIEDWLSQTNFWQNHIYPEDLDAALQIYNEAIKHHQNCEFEYRLVAVDGRIIWIYDISTLVYDSDGNMIATTGLFIDISDLKQVETDLHLSNERLELTIQELQRATRLKDEFLATMSHELRTPLNAILGMSEALQEELFGDLNPRQLNSISAIEKSGEHLLSLINDILDVSKISAGKLELDITPVDLNELCQSSLVFIKQQAFEKRIKVSTYIPANLDSVLVDKRRMRQVLINLLTNAVKFTNKEGIIQLSVEIEISVNHQTADYYLCFSVSDNGIGINHADLSKLFQPFIQLDSSLNRQYEGTGLGLVLVKQIVELHGGAVTIDSEVGTGSCFKVRLPQTYQKLDCMNLVQLGSATIIPATPRDLSWNHSPTVCTILLAEDNEVNINTFFSYLTAKGYRIIMAHNGREAINLTATELPDLILMDIQMPDMDGITAIEHLRQQSPPVQIPIIALTALVMAGDREKCLAAGADRYLTKPIKLRELHHNIQECLNLN